MKMKKEITVISIVLLIMVSVLGFSFKYLAEEQNDLGGSYEECLEDNSPGVCKDVFLF